VKLLVDHGADCNLDDSMQDNSIHRVCLHSATINASLELVILLLDRDANLETKKEFALIALHLASNCYDPSIYFRIIALLLIFVHRY
jgi:ankyrin repeat protein